MFNTQAQIPVNQAGAIAKSGLDTTEPVVDIEKNADTK